MPPCANERAAARWGFRHKRASFFDLAVGAAGGRNEETYRITQAREERSKVRIGSEPQAGTAGKIISAKGQKMEKRGCWAIKRERKGVFVLTIIRQLDIKHAR